MKKQHLSLSTQASPGDGLPAGRRILHLVLDPCEINTCWGGGCRPIRRERTTGYERRTEITHEQRREKIDKRIRTLLSPLLARNQEAIT